MTTVVDRKEMTVAFAEAAELVRTGALADRAGRILPVGEVTALRQRLGLTHDEFAERYGIPIDIVEAWERGTTRPDAISTAFLKLIAADPIGVARTLSPEVVK